MLVIAASTVTLSRRRVAVKRKAVRSDRTLERTPCEPSTVTWKVHVAAFPAASMAVLETDVVPMGNTLSDGGTEIGEITPEQLSAAWIVNETGAPDSFI